MAQNEIDKIREKIAKLLNKAESAKEIGNAAEAAVFSAKVNELLMKYNLEKADLHFAEEDPIIADGDNGLVMSKKMGRWTSKLFGIICHYNLCKDIYTSYGRQKNMSVTIIGEKENVDIVLFLYDILKEQLERVAKGAWKVYIKDIKSQLANHPAALIEPRILDKPWTAFRGVSNRAAFYKSFFLGAVHGVAMKLEAEQKKAEETYGDKVTTLVRVSDSKIKDFVKENFSNLGSFQSRKSKVNGSAYNAGIEAGKNASIARGVATGNSVATKSLR